MEARHRPAPGRSRRSQRARRPQGREVELAVLWRRRSGLVPHFSLLHELREGRAFFRGAALRPPPPGESRTPDMRYLDIHEEDQIDEDLLGRWIRQGSKLPGWIP